MPFLYHVTSFTHFFANAPNRLPLYSLISQKRYAAVPSTHPAHYSSRVRSSLYVTRNQQHASRAFSRESRAGFQSKDSPAAEFGNFERDDLSAPESRGLVFSETRNVDSATLAKRCSAAPYSCSCFNPISF